MGATRTGLVTVAEFERMKDPPGFRLELHHGGVVEVTFVKPDHADIQDRLVDLLRAALKSGWKIRAELMFRPQPEHEVWSADVAVMKLDRWRSALDHNVYPLGSPELVIEVLSPSNTVSEMYDRQQTCLDGGCLEFWVVDPVTKRVHVNSPDGPTRTYHAGQNVPVNVMGAVSIPVNQIFND